MKNPLVIIGAVTLIIFGIRFGSFGALISTIVAYYLLKYFDVIAKNSASQKGFKIAISGLLILVILGLAALLVLMYAVMN